MTEFTINQTELKKCIIEFFCKDIYKEHEAEFARFIKDKHGNATMRIQTTKRHKLYDFSEIINKHLGNPEIISNHLGNSKLDLIKEKIEQKYGDIECNIRLYGLNELLICETKAYSRFVLLSHDKTWHYVVLHEKRIEDYHDRNRMNFWITCIRKNDNPDDEEIQYDRHFGSDKDLEKIQGDKNEFSFYKIECGMDDPSSEDILIRKSN